MRIVTCAAFSGLLSLATASVGTVSTDELTKRSELILTAKVERIFKRGGVDIASARVLTRVKGKVETSKIEYLASRTWKCDITKASVGETVLLFLQECKVRTTSFGQNLEKALSDQTLYEIAYSGRGRVPLTLAKGVLTAQVSRYNFHKPWTLAVNHALPKGCPVRLAGENEGVVSWADLRKRITPANP